MNRKKRGNKMHLKKLSKEEKSIFKKYYVEENQKEQLYIYNGRKFKNSKLRKQERIKRMIGIWHDGVYHKVFPRLIESRMEKLDGISGVTIVGKVKDATENELVAFVVLDENQQWQELEQILIDYAKKNLEIWEQPAEYRNIEQFPRTGIGKVDYRKLENMANEERKVKYEPELLLGFMSLYLDEWKHRDEIMWPQMFRFYSASLVVSLLPYMDKLIGIEEIPKWIFHIFGLIMSMFCAFIMWSYGCKLQASSDTYNQLIDKVDIEICKRKKVEDTCRGRLGKSLLKIPLAKCIPSFLFASLVLINIVFLIIELI